MKISTKLLIPLILWTSTFAILAGARAQSPVAASGFEDTPTQGRTLLSEGGNPADASNNPLWKKAGDSAKFTEGGTVVLGLTDEVARSGKQSLFVSFDNVTTKYRGATIASSLIPVQAGGVYRLSLWMRGSEAKPIKDGVNVKATIIFLQDDESTEIGKTAYLDGNVAAFPPGGWSEFSKKITAPELAAFAQVSWSWHALPAEPPANGEVFVDDFSFAKE